MIARRFFMFGKRIVELRKNKGLTQTELAKSLEISRSALSLYEIEKREPDISTLNKLAALFDVPVGYILGEDSTGYALAEEKEVNSSEQKYFYFFFDDKDLLRDTFIKRLTSAMADEGMSESDFICSVPIGSERASAILKGELDPSANDLIELSQFLNTSIDYLLGQIPALSTSEKKLLNTFVKLSEDNKDILIGKSKELLQSQRYEESVAAEAPLREAK
jgi:transcriptional regulator with XRE-family HTH domain